jgi:hypothetical protein
VLSIINILILICICDNISFNYIYLNLNELISNMFNVYADDDDRLSKDIKKKLYIDQTPKDRHMDIR